MLISQEATEQSTSLLYQTLPFLPGKPTTSHAYLQELSEISPAVLPDSVSWTAVLFDINQVSQSVVLPHGRTDPM